LMRWEWWDQKVESSEQTLHSTRDFLKFEELVTFANAELNIMWLTSNIEMHLIPRYQLRVHGLPHRGKQGWQFACISIFSIVINPFFSNC
jgi:hypothetical protein